MTGSPWDDAEPVRDMAREAKPGDRWPFEPPAEEKGPDGGVREPRTPTPVGDSGAADDEER